MPVITSEGEDGVVTAWFVDEGGVCTEGQLIAEVQAEKVAAEVVAPADGQIVDRAVIGEVIAQGAPVCRIVDWAGPVAPVTEAGESADLSHQTVVKASPAAKRVARERGVDLAAVVGSGPEGRVTVDDVEEASGSGSGALRAVIARNLRRSRDETVPVTLFSTVDLGIDVPSRLTAHVVRAAALALLQHPRLNGARDGNTFVSASAAHISVAIQTVDGLVAPVVHDADSRSVEEIDAAIRDLAERARSNQTTASDYDGGTFTVSNLGRYGVEGFTPLINLPQVAILGAGAARLVPVADSGGSISSRHQMMLSLTFDHAFIDGVPAAEFLEAIREFLSG